MSIAAAVASRRYPPAAGGGGGPTPPYLASLVLSGPTSGVVTHTAGPYEVVGYDQYGIVFAGTPGPFTFRSSATGVATITTGTGIATGVSAGDTDITVQVVNSRGQTITSNAVTLTVAAQVATTVTVSPSAATIASGAQAFTATVYDQAAVPNAIAGASVAWDSSDTGVATIDSGTGIATAVADGTTTTTATSGAASGTATLSVSTSDVTSVSIAYNSDPADALLLLTGTSYPFVAKDQNGTVLSGAGTWSTDDGTNFPIDATMGTLVPAAGGAGKGVTITYTHTATGHTASCVGTALTPWTEFAGDDPTRYTTQQQFMAQIASYISTVPSYNSYVPTGNGGTARYNDGRYCNLLLLDPTVRFMGNQTFAVNFPANGGPPELRGYLSAAKSRLWTIVLKRWRPGFTFVGSPNSGGAGYKDSIWLTWPGYSGRVGPLYGNGGSNNGTGGAPGGTIDNDTYFRNGTTNALLGGKEETSIGTFTTEFVDGAWWADIMVAEVRAGNILSSRSWHVKLGNDVTTPLGGLQEGPYIAGQSPVPFGGFSAFGENYNQNPPNALLKSQAFWAIVDGEQYGDPFGILGTQTAPTLSGISGGTVTVGDTGASIVLTGTQFNDNCWPIFSNTGIKVQTITMDSATQCTVVVNVSATATAGAGTVVMYNAASQDTTATQVVTVQAQVAPDAPTADNADAVASTTLTFPVTLAATGTLPTALLWRYRVNGSGSAYTDGPAITLSNPSLGQTIEQPVVLPAASTTYDVQFAASNGGGASAYTVAVTGTTAGAASLITTNLTLDLDADTGTDVSTDGAAVGSWTDQSSTGAQFFQGTASKKPTLQIDLYNGHHAIRFASANQQNLTTSAPVTALNSQDVTLYVVAAPRSNSPSSNQRLFSNLNFNGGAAVEGYFLQQSSGGTTVLWEWGKGTASPGGFTTLTTDYSTTNGLRVLVGLANHTTPAEATYIDGAAGGTGATAFARQTTSPTVVSVGSDKGSANYADMDVVRILQYSGAHTPSEVAQNCAALKALYGTP